MTLPIVLPDWVRTVSTAPAGPPILIAEDDTEMQRLLCEALDHERAPLVTCGSGLHLLHALESARQRGQRPRLVITDLRMPGANGLDVVRVMRSWGWDMPVIVISGFADDSVQERARELGVAAVFSKPFDLDALQETAAQLLREAQP